MIWDDLLNAYKSLSLEEGTLLVRFPEEGRVERLSKNTNSTLAIYSAAGNLKELIESQVQGDKVER